MRTDERGLPLTTSSDAAVAHFDTTIREYLEYRLAAIDSLQRTLAADPEFVMGHCLKGYFGLLACTVTTHHEVRQALEFAEARLQGLTPREQRHVAALRAWLHGDLLTAGAHWDAILLDHPTDILALRLQHFATFWTGKSMALRDGIARAFAAWDERAPGYSYVLGMYAFGLEEAGDYATAEAYGKRAVDLNPDDLWAIHAVAHVLEMQGRLHDGQAWLSYPGDAWGDRNAVKGHLWWHAALYPFELGEYDGVLELYDQRIWKPQNAFYIDIQNAAALLWRLEFQGVDVGDRWQELAQVCETRIADHVLAFTDLHVMIALIMAGRLSAADQCLASLRAFADTPDNFAASTMAAVTLPMCESMLAYGRGAYDEAVERLLPRRYDYACVGGSHAQRDVFAQFLIDAACRAERWPLACALLAERAALRPNSRGTWLHYAQALDQLGETARAAAARQHAAEVC
jgi:tetratricopeptide (TPR) repeat protein